MSAALSAASSRDMTPIEYSARRRVTTSRVKLAIEFHLAG